MSRRVVAFLVAAAVLCLALTLGLIVAAAVSGVSGVDEFRTFVRLGVFRYTGLAAPKEPGELKALYLSSCSGRCHGREPIERERHTSREWDSIIKRMNDKNGAGVKAREAVLIGEYLQKNYGSNVPTILSPEANRFLKQHLWRSDFGESDLYVDIIYATPQYFEILAGPIERKNLEADKYTVFMVYLNTHQNRLDPYPLKDMAVLAVENPAGKLHPIDWRVTYESGDMHHLEGVLRFEKTPFKPGWMDLTLTGLPGQKERVFRWALPVPDAPQASAGEDGALK